MVGPTGHFPASLGTYTWQELVLVFREQVEALAAGGVDLILLETFADLGEIRAALFAAKNYTTHQCLFLLILMVTPLQVPQMFRHSLKHGADLIEPIVHWSPNSTHN